MNAVVAPQSVSDGESTLPSHRSVGRLDHIEASPAFLECQQPPVESDGGHAVHPHGPSEGGVHLLVGNSVGCHDE